MSDAATYVRLECAGCHNVHEVPVWQVRLRLAGSLVGWACPGCRHTQETPVPPRGLADAAIHKQAEARALGLAIAQILEHDAHQTARYLADIDGWLNELGEL